MNKKKRIDLRGNRERRENIFMLHMKSAKMERKKNHQRIYLNLTQKFQQNLNLKFLRRQNLNLKFPLIQ
jgi:hypothetical protein